MNINFQEGVKVQGEFDFLFSSREVQEEMRRRLAIGRQAFLNYVEAGIMAGSIRKLHYLNLIPIVSRQQITKALSGNISSVLEIKVTHQELGTSTQASANTDTGLITPTASTRKAVTSLAFSSNQLNITSFWVAGEATGAWKEFGTFINGSGISNSGILFNRISINITIAASEALTIDGTVTYN